MAGSSNADPEGDAEIHYKASMLNAFKNCCSQSEIFVIYTMDGCTLQVSRDLLLLFSPLLRDLFDTLPSHPSRSDSTPVLVLPDFDSSSVFRLMKLISSGEAGGFRNRLEGIDVLNLSKLLQVGIDILHNKDGSPYVLTRRKRTKTPPTFPKPIVVETAATVIKKENENEVSNEDQQEQSQFEDMQEKEMERTKEKGTLGTSGSQLMLTFDGGDGRLMGEDAKTKSPISTKTKKGFNCGICPQKSFKTVNQLYSHYIGTHFKTEIASFIDDGACKECGKSFDLKGKVELHVGINHGKIIDLLRSQNLWSEGGAHETSSSSPIMKVVSAKKSTVTKKTKKLDISTSNMKKQSPTFKKLEHDVDFVTTSPISEKANDPNSGSKRPNSLVQEDQANKMQSPSPKKIRKTSDDNCNYELKCEVCLKEFKFFNQLETHMVKHFSKDVEAIVVDYMNGNECKLCGDSFKHKGHLISHLGCKHGYINDVLREKNFSVLPCAVNNTYSASKQKTLARIKKEREEKNSEGNPSTDELRRELMMEDDQDTNLLSGQASTDEILNKYKDQIN